MLGPPAWDSINDGLKPGVVALPLALLAVLGALVVLDRHVVWRVQLTERQLILHRRSTREALELSTLDIVTIETWPWPTHQLAIAHGSGVSRVLSLQDEEEFLDKLKQRAPHVSVREQ